MNWKTSRYEVELIEKVVARAEALAKKHGVPFNRMNAHMDVTACHCNGSELKLAEMADPGKVQDSDFAHDFFGIQRHIDRSTGKLQDCFVPRCAL